MEEIGLFETINTQRQPTRFKPDPVPKEAIEKIIDAATKAPSGVNSQPWDFVVITDRDLISGVGQLYHDAWLEAIVAESESPIIKAARYLANHMSEAPVLILVCVDDSRGYIPHTPGQPIVRDLYASSIWLAVQNLFLAARGLGLGTRLTTAHIRREPEIKALLGIPDHVETVVLTPLGYPKGRFGPPNRRPGSEVTSYNRWGNRG